MPIDSTSSAPAHANLDVITSHWDENQYKPDVEKLTLSPGQRFLDQFRTQKRGDTVNTLRVLARANKNGISTRNDACDLLDAWTQIESYLKPCSLPDYQTRIEDGYVRLKLCGETVCEFPQECLTQGDGSRVICFNRIYWDEAAEKAVISLRKQNMVVELIAPDIPPDRRITISGSRSKSESWLLGLNGKVYFADNNTESIVCRHLAGKYVEDSENHKEGKVNLLENYSSADKIQGRITWDMNKKYADYTHHVPEGSFLICSEDFGQLLHHYFTCMERRYAATGTDEDQHAAFLIGIRNDDNSGHAMALRLRIKNKGGEKTYVASVYDPNLTSVAKRYAHSSPDKFGTLRDFMLLNKYAAKRITGRPVCVIPVSKGEWSGEGKINVSQVPAGAMAVRMALEYGLMKEVERQVSGFEQLPGWSKVDFVKNLVRAFNFDHLPSDAKKALSDHLVNCCAVLAEPERIKLLTEALAKLSYNEVLPLLKLRGHNAALDDFLFAKNNSVVDRRIEQTKITAQKMPRPHL